ncbi:MAG: hypothetical protein JWN75_1122, partial [Candidatus Saccharibacteria bacterium]|nr:hypothetical protein [Candidatus Saccharibacteria bacterium]
MATNADKFLEVGSPGSATTLVAPGYTAASSTSINVVSTTNWPSTTAVAFAMDRAELVNGVETRIAGTYCEFVGIVGGPTTITSVVKTYGTAQDYPAGSLTRVYIPVSSTQQNRIVQGVRAHANDDGTLKTSAVQSALGLTTLSNYIPLGQTFNTVTYNGNRSYTGVVNGVDVVTGILSPGMRLRTTRTVAAPTQCTNLNGTNQYWSKTSPAGMTFTDDFTVSAWVKLTSYQQGTIISRQSAAGGWIFGVGTAGQVELFGFNTTGANFSGITSYQSIPLNKWVHVSAQLDMSAFTATTTTSYVMIDGVDVPSTVARGGTSPTALTQAGNLEIGSRSGGTVFFNGKIAQPAVFNSKVTQTTIQSYYSQGLTGTEPTLISAYSFNGNANDLNTTNANNLTAMNAAVATNADSPFGGQADGTISSTLDYAIVQKATFSTNSTIVFQVPEGCTVPTSGGVASVVYSSNKAPYGMPTQSVKWTLLTQLNSELPVGTVANTWYGGNFALSLPAGEWKAQYEIGHRSEVGAAGYRDMLASLSTSSTTENDSTWQEFQSVGSLNGTVSARVQHRRSGSLSPSIATTYYGLVK